jgi:ABC-type transport system involved in cytochrome bd biosynthesis fused ATPase/permease subunit
MRFFLKYLELILTAAGVLVVVVFFSAFRNIAPWKAAALSAVAVGVLHGAIFFAVRSAQRSTRSKELRSIRQTLNDLMRNKLQVVMFAAEIKNQDWRPEAQQAVQEIQNRLNAIEGEALTFKRGE